MPTTLPIRPEAGRGRFPTPRLASKPPSSPAKHKRHARWGFRHDVLCFVLVALGTLITCAQADAQDGLSTPVAIDLIVERRADSIELYIGGNARVLTQHFGAASEAFINEDGHVPFEAFQAGTWLLGDALLQGVAVQLGGQNQRLEATSLMMHPADREVPFADAVDGVLAVSICAVLNPPSDLTLEEATMYAGYIGFTSNTTQPLTLGYPHRTTSQPNAITVQVRDYANGRLTRQSTQIWSPGKPLHIAPGLSASTATLTLLAVTLPHSAMGLLLLLGMLGLGTFAHTRLRPRLLH